MIIFAGTGNRRPPSVTQRMQIKVKFVTKLNNTLHIR